MLGGCTGRNYMIYQRGTIGSYDKWAEEVEDDSYTFENLLPWFEKSLNFTPPNIEYRGQNATPEFDTSALGTGDGPLSVTYPNYAYSFPTWSISALKEIGMDVVPGFQNGELMGQSWALFTIDAESQTRESSETAFLRRSLDNTNYYLYDMTMAKKIIFDDSKKATGVLVDTLGMEYTLSARKEVILSAGAIGSPQLLQVSGVGPAELLEQNNIPIVSDLPGVGQNMQDHILFGITHRVNTLTASTVIQDAEFAAEQNRLFVEEARGTPTSPGMDILGWEKFPDHVRQGMSNRTLGILENEYPADWPEIEYITLSSYLGDFWNPGTADPRDGSNYATFSVLMTTPRSRGSVNITSSDTLKQPDINPNYLTDRADVDVAVAGFKRARDFWKTEAIAELTDPEEAYPGSAVQSDEEIEENIRKSFQTVFHGSCTCAMGPESNPRAVIDTRARVYGVQNLRVADASSFPFLPPGHPQSTICEFSSGFYLICSKTNIHASRRFGGEDCL